MHVQVKTIFVTVFQSNHLDFKIADWNFFVMYAMYVAILFLSLTL